MFHLICMLQWLVFEVYEIMFFKWNQMVGFLLNISSVFLLLYLAMTPACVDAVH